MNIATSPGLLRASSIGEAALSRPISGRERAHRVTGTVVGAGGPHRLCPCGCGKVLPKGEMCPARKERLFARKRAADARRPNASERGYDSKWAKARKTFLARNPKCARCDAPATVVDHIIAHNGDSAIFWDTKNWQGLCDHHHNVAKQSEEKRKPKLSTPFVRKPRIPVTIVCGPAGSGKSTYVAEHRGERDLVIDLDVIRSRLAGTALHDDQPRWLKPALEVRNRLIDGLASDTEHARAWFIISAPEKAERDLWAKKLSANVVLLDVPLDECVRRLKASRTDAERHVAFATDWWRRFEADQSAQAGGGPSTLAKVTLTGPATVSRNSLLKPKKGEPDAPPYPQTDDAAGDSAGRNFDRVAAPRTYPRGVR